MRGAEFAGLAAFAAVIEHRTFVRAAAHLAVTPSALSQTIRQLEERIGVRLLNRTTRSVAPTDVGATLYARLRPAMTELDGAIAEAMSAHDRAAGRLRINMPRLAAVSVVAPRLGRFHRDNPDVELDLVVQDSLADIVAGRFDAGIRIGERLEKDMIAVAITPDMEMYAVASPDYVEKHSAPRTPADLHKHACLNWRWPTDGSLYRWEFEHKGKEFEVAVEGPLVATDPELILQGALQGIGIAYTFDERIEGWLAEGRLVRVLRAYSPRFPGLRLYYPHRRQQTPALKAFIECLLDRDVR